MDGLSEKATQGKRAIYRYGILQQLHNQVTNTTISLPVSRLSRQTLLAVPGTKLCKRLSCEYLRCVYSIRVLDFCYFFFLFFLQVKDGTRVTIDEMNCM